MAQPLLSGLYEPEGIYLNAPFDGTWPILQFWGSHAEYYAQFKYNGVPLKGHPGIDFGIDPGVTLVAVDSGRVVEISVEPGGFERYIKLEHRWGESLYARIGKIQVESGQSIKRGDPIALSGPPMDGQPAHLHFAVRIAPFNRFDGWGGFSDPLPFLNPNSVQADEGPGYERSYGREYENADDPEDPELRPHPMAVERPGMRRP
jgi:murein DD-endopeptidase MepM/ murein hydrolase activator NlpD